MNELQFQRYLCHAARDLGGYAHKLSNRFLVGIPDLIVKLPALPACLIECKRVQRSLKTGPKNGNEYEWVQFTPRVTELQHHNLTAFQKAGGYSGLVVLIEGRKWPQLIFAEPHGEMYVKGTIRCNKSSLIWRNRGEKWPIHEIVQNIVQGAREENVDTQRIA